MGTRLPSGVFSTPCQMSRTLFLRVFVYHTLFLPPASPPPLSPHPRSQADAGVGEPVQRGLLPEPEHEGRADPGAGEEAGGPHRRQRAAKGRGDAASQAE